MFKHITILVPAVAKSFNANTEHKIKKHESTTKYKKHRADKGFRELSALKELSSLLTGKCSEGPTFFIQSRWVLF